MPDTSAWKPVDETSAWKPVEEPATPTPQSPLKSIASGMGSQIIHNLNPMTALSGVGHAIAHPIDALSGDSESAARAPKDWAAGHPIDAASDWLQGHTPILGPIAANAKRAMDANDPSAMGKAAGDLISLKAVPAVYGGVGKLIGKGLGATAAPTAETALAVRNVDRMYSRDPGHAILNEIGGVRPTTIAANAKGKVGQLSGEVDKLDSAATAQGKTASIAPALQKLNQSSDSAEQFGSRVTPSGIAPMRQFLTEPTAKFAGNVDPGPTLSPGGRAGVISAEQTPTQLRGMKRIFGKDYVNFQKERVPDPVSGAAKGAYHEMDAELDKAVPESAALNDRISNLIPVAARAGDKSLNAGPIQQLLGRFATPTGALAGMTGGAATGFHSGGPLGAVAGGVIGAGLPALLSSPTAQMIYARTVNQLGKSALPGNMGAALGTAALLKKKQPEQ